MICYKCKREIGKNQSCPYCGYDNSVSVMSEREKNNYVGETIDDENSRRQSNYRQTSSQSYRIWNVSSGKNWVSRIIFGVCIAAVLAFVLFVALPFLSIAVLSIMVIWIVFKILH